MGKAQAVVNRATDRAPHPTPTAEAMSGGVRQAQPDGSITILEGWDRPGQRREHPTAAPVVDRSPRHIAD